MTSTSLKWQTCSIEDFPFKRNKVSKACQLCRRKKIRCDGRAPCRRCEQQNSPCHYDEQGQHRRRKQSISNGDVYSNNDHPTKAPLSLRIRPPPSISLSPTLLSSCHYLPFHSARISFDNSLYESMRQQCKGDAISRSHLLATRVPPLLFDFFHLTSQPCKIWASFIQLFLRFDRSGRTEEKWANALLEESLALFAKHNHVYAALFDWQHLVHKNTVGVGALLLGQHQAPDDDNDDSTILVYAIHALVFRAAFQSLATTSQDIAPSLEDYAHVFHREAQRRFLNITFVKPPSHESTAHRLNLVRAAILLTHYHCTAVAEESAYMILKVGMSHASSCLLSEMVLDGKPSSEPPLPEKRRLKRLFFILHAWHTWLAFYLDREDWPEDTHLEGAIDKTQSDIRADGSMATTSAWAFQVVDLYIRLIRRVLKNKPIADSADIENQLETIHDACHLSDSNSKSTYGSNLLPAQIAVLYHHVLVIQLFSYQYTLDGVRHDPRSKNKATMLDTNTVSQSCLTAATAIIDVVDNLTMTYHTPMTEQNSRLRDQQHRDPINPAVLYPICLATSVIDTSMRGSCTPVRARLRKQRRLQGPAAWDSNSSKVPVFKLQRLLNPICSQIAAARVIFEPLDRIQAAARSIASSSVATTTNVLASAAAAAAAAAEVAAAATTTTTTTTDVEMRQQPTRAQPQRSALSNAAEATKVHNSSNKLIARFSEPLWSDTTNFEHPFPDDIYLYDMPLPSKHMSSSRYMVNPYMLDRNEIDKQQLEKLSSIKVRRSAPSMENMPSNDHTFHMYGSAGAPIPPAPMPVFSPTMLRRRNRAAGHPHTAMLHQGQKRRYTESMVMEYQQKQASTLANMGRNPLDYPRAVAAAAAAAVSARPAAGEFSNPSLIGASNLAIDSLPLYHEEYFLVDFNNSATGPVSPAINAPGNPNPDRASGNMAPDQSQMFMHPGPHPSQLDLVRDGSSIKETIRHAVTSANGSFTSGNLVSDNPPRQLPLPPPKQQTPKNWAAISHQRGHSEPFQASVIETLHPNTLATYSFGSLCPSTLGFVQDHQQGTCMSTSAAHEAIQQMAMNEDGINYFFNMDPSTQHTLAGPASLSVQPSSSVTHPANTAADWIYPSKLARASSQNPKRSDEGNRQHQFIPSSSTSSTSSDPSSHQNVSAGEVSSASPAAANSDPAVVAVAASVLGQESQQWLEMTSSCSKISTEAAGDIFGTWQG